MSSLAKLRAWWFERQGLTPRAAATTVADCVRRAGWMPTAGSTGIYLSMRARMPGVTRDAVDRAVLDGTDIIEVQGPHARPPVLVPRDEMALALRLHAASYEKHVAPLVRSGRLDQAAIRAIGAQACRALDEGPLTTAAIRAAVTHPDAGELLVGAIVHLLLRGIIRRYPADGRVDSSKYAYELRHPDDRPDLDSEGDTASVALAAVRRILRRHGPASAAEIAEAAVLTKSAVRQALTALGAERIRIAGWTDEAWLLAEDVPAWNAFAPNGPHVALLPYRDPFVSARRPQAVLARRDISPVLNTALKPAAIRDVTVLHHHAVVASGEMIGVWEYDADAARVVARVWHADKVMRRRVAEAAAATERFISKELGDLGLSAVDPPAKRSRRLAFCGRA